MKRNSDEYYMKLAANESRKAMKNGCAPFGCVILNKDNMVIGKAGDRVNKHTDPTRHCVTLAIQLACKNLNTTDLSECKMYCTSEPCNMCKGAIQNVGIPEITYANDRDDITAIGLKGRELDHIEYKEFLIKSEEAKNVFLDYMMGRN